MFIYCDNEDCKNEGRPMEVIEEDSRQEWSEITYCCSGCAKAKVHRQEYDQNGLIILDEVKVWDGQ